jgi:hypothetical protein
MERLVVSVMVLNKKDGFLRYRPRGIGAPDSPSREKVLPAKLLRMQVLEARVEIPPRMWSNFAI